MSKDTTNSSPVSFKDFTLKIEGFKGKRDELNKKTKEYINNLQDIDSDIIKLLTTAKDVFKRKRDSWNKKVKELKVKKVEYKTLLDNLIEERKKIPKAKETGPKKFISVNQIERKIENLERMIETESLDISEENDIIDKIRALAEQKQEQVIAQENDNFYKIERKIEIVKINLNKIYESLNKWSNKSQENHKNMLEMYQQANELKDKKKVMEEKLIENKKAADNFHEQFLEVMKIKKKKFKGKKSFNRKPRTGPRYKSKHNELLEKLKKEKLSTALEKQKAGKKLNLFEARLILEQHKN